MDYGQDGPSRSRKRARRRSPRRRLGGPVGMAGYVFTCAASALILAVSGVGYFVRKGLYELGSSHAIQGARSNHSAANILLIGLDSRKDQDGHDLPAAILKQLHAGSKRGVDAGVGGYNTNTLILLHVPNDDSKATAFSIPRDDYVTYTGAIGPQQHGKIKEAYGVTKYYTELQLAKRGVHGSALEHRGREAARKATIATVRNLTGVPIDHFAEISLAGFYDLATALGGVEVCLNHPVKDSFSGADFPAGRQHLNGAQALAFVRQRHGLTNGDLDRTHRQQAFLSSVTHQLRTQGVFKDLRGMQNLLSVAQKDVVIDDGWDILGFARRASDLTGGNIEFHTLPIERYDLINGQDVNIIDQAKIKTIVRAAFSRDQQRRPSPSTTQTAIAPPTLDVLNGSRTAGLAARVAVRLSGLGYANGKVGNTKARSRTIVRYGTGAGRSARKIAKILGVTATVSAAVPAGHVEVDLGDHAALPDLHAGSNRAIPAPVIPTNGAQGGVVQGNGIPCVD